MTAKNKSAKNNSAVTEEAYQLAFDYELESACCPQCVFTTYFEPSSVPCGHLKQLRSIAAFHA